MRAALGLVLVAALAPVLSGPASGQEASARETRCWVGDVAFTAGLRINVGDGLAVCEAGVGWRDIADQSAAGVAGCLLDGELSSVGAVVSVHKDDDLLLQCDASGRWVTIEG